ncbi:hypothetical protein PLUTO_00260 [Luteibacter phage vB_LflM-Pluto]|uniref:Uncharacterized protein n=1 Tax=Luteibacter phage vB_LflM-Pluto TaxID=2948611 RepID=A0A9E7MV33_9CAUD|nr:hypothetical protein PLUTO_00260 [Luteibacter phage vB_LflM-Pluto]
MNFIPSYFTHGDGNVDHPPQTRKPRIEDIAMKLEAVATATSKELVEFYNAHNPDKQIKKFSDRETAERRIKDLIALIEAEAAEKAAAKAARNVEKASASVVKAAKDVERAAHNLAASAKGEAKAPKIAQEKPSEAHTGTTGEAPTSARASVEKAISALRAAPAALPRSNAAGIAESWKVTEVRDARLTRNGVIVVTERGAHDYASTRAAFIALGLPLEKHIRFRVKLKEAGKLVFEHNNRKYEFQITD